MRNILVFVLLFSSFTASAQQTSDHPVIAVLDAQVHAWNQGDIVSFMNGYLASDSTQFVSAKGITEGYQRVLERYLSAYPTKEKMGELALSNLKIRAVSSDIAIVVGRWDLRRSDKDGGNVGGYFTLVFQKTATGWKIIHDHTS